MITIANISVKYGDRILFNNINLTIMPKDRVGLVGRNGAGKSTLLKIIANYQSADSGNINYPNGSTLGFLHQDLDLPKGKTVMAETLTAFGAAKELEARIEEINVELTERTDYESQAYANLLDELSDATERFQLLGGQTMQADAERVLLGLGFKHADMGRLTDEFSGGWKMRIELAKMLLQRPDYLMLDEPTNHLDIESILWLENYLKTYEGAVIIISHDKTFLDNTTKRTIEIELGKIYDYKAAYSKYKQLRVERKALQESAFKNQQKVIAQRERTITRFMAKATKTKMAQSMKKQLDKLERIELEDEDTSAMRIQFQPAPRSGQIALEIEKLIKRYGDLTVLNQVDFKMERGDKVAFVGQNGQGKTTLSKIIAKVETLTGGQCKLGYNVQIGYYAQNQAESLHPNLTVLQTMENVAPNDMRVRVRGILGAFMFSGEDVDKKVSVLSGGERARLALACMLLHPFNLLILDEPTNHLDMISKEVLKKALLKYDGSMIVVSHDRDFLQGLTNRTLEFRDKQLYNYIGDVYAFLKKRQLDNMREVEKATQKKTAAKKAELITSKPQLSYEERKRLQKTKRRYEKAIQEAEKQIEKLEATIEKIELQMANPNFYQQSDSNTIITNYKAAKNKLEETMESWEENQLELEIFIEEHPEL